MKPQSLNRYAYVQNDPVNFVDPTGLDFASPWPDTNPGFISANQQGWEQIINNPLSFLTLRTVTFSGEYFDIVEETPITQGPPQITPPTLADALKLAASVLGKDGPCKDLFKKKNGLSTLKSLEKKGNIKVKDMNVNLPDGRSGKLSSFPELSAVTTGNKVTINPSGRMALGKGSAQFPKLSPLESFAAGIIHELLHVTKDFPPERGNRNQVAMQSLLNQSDVVAACFPKANP